MLNGNSYDIAVVGGGVVGLWVARLAVQAGLSVALIDRDGCGSGASGTVLGALLPHLPRVMSAKKIFQFHALAELSDLIAELEDDTGLDAGYIRCGRIMPIRTPRYREHAQMACNGSRQGWHQAETGFAVEIRDTKTADGWIDPQTAPLGLIYDTLSARIISQKYTAALKAFVQAHATVMEGEEVIGLDTRTRQIITRNGPLEVTAQHLVLTAGYETFPLVADMLERDLGMGVKGQAAVFEIAPMDTVPPIIYDNGVYVVPHGPGRCAVGSTSEETFGHPTFPDPAKAAEFIERAKALCLPLRSGRLVKHWAGVRPRSAAKDPIVGCLDPDKKIHVATGGYKITLGIAHRLARRLVDELTGAKMPTVVPETYEVGHHLRHSI